MLEVRVELGIVADEIAWKEAAEGLFTEPRGEVCRLSAARRAIKVKCNANRLWEDSKTDALGGSLL